MSWLADLAGKAEDFLVKIDHNTAQALNKDSPTPSHSRRGSTASVSSDYRTVKHPVAAVIKDDVASPLQSVRSPAKREKKLLKGKDQDEELLAMLNTQESPLPEQSNSSHTRAASLGAVSFIENGAPPTNGNFTKSTKSNSTHSDLSLPEENALLRKEIHSLSQEIRQALQRAKSAELETSRLQSQAKSQSSLVTKLEEEQSVLRRENVRLADELLHKDSHQSALETKLAAVQIDLTRCREEEQTDAEKLQSLNAELTNSAKQLEEEKLHFQTSLSQAQSKILQLEQSNDSLSADSKSARQQLQENSRLLAQHSASLAATREELTGTQTAFNDYKLRAQRILTDKDKLISEIKEGAGLQSHVLSEAEVEHLRQERDLLREEGAQTVSHLNALRQEMLAMEQRYETEIRNLRETQTAIEAELQHEKRQRAAIEEETRSAQEELRYLRQDSAQQRAQASTRLRESETEVLRLRSQLAAKRHSNATEQELERRLQSTTETLLSKQAALEAAHAERSSLTVQLERKERELRESYAAQHRITMNITDDAKASTGITNTGMENGIKRRVRRAYGTIDALNIRLGAALRRYPIARVGVLIYMVLLHVWVGIVLVTYSPETHGPNHQK